MNQQELPPVLTNDDEQLPPLSILHLLVATTAIAITFGIVIQVWRPPNTEKFEWLYLTGSVMSQVVTSLGATLILWTIVRFIRARATPLPDPGAKFAALLGLKGTLSLTLSLVLYSLLEGGFRRYQIVTSAFVLWRLVSILLSIGALFWIKQIAWRLVIVVNMLPTFHALTNELLMRRSNPSLQILSLPSDPPAWVWLFFDLISYAAPLLALAMIAGSYFDDHRSKQNRYWTHHLGALFLLLIATSYWIQEIWIRLQAA